MDLSELNLSVRDYNAVKRFGINTAEELVERLPYFCEHAKATAGRVTEALHEHGMLPFKIGQWVEPDQCGEEIEPGELKTGDFVIMGFPTESKDWRKVVLIRAVDGDDLLYLDGSGGAPHCRLGDHHVWSIRSEKEEYTSMSEETKAAVICSEDYTKAVEADALVNAGMELMGSGLYQMCIGVKKMHDGKLYKEFGYQNFEDYCKSKGFTKQHGGRLVKIAEMAEAENGTSGFHFESLGFKKNYLLSLLEPEDRQELIATQNVDGMTVKELEAAKAEIDRLKQERDENEHAAALLSEELDSAKESLARAQDEKEAAVDDCKNYFNGVIREKDNRIKELEDAPIMHDITDADLAEENKRLKRELEDEQLRVMMAEKSAESRARKAADEARHELTKMHETELQTLKDGYEKQLAENAQETDEDALDEARFNSFRLIFEELVDEMENLLEDMEDDPRIAYVKRLDDYWAKNLLYLKSKGAGA